MSSNTKKSVWRRMKNKGTISAVLASLVFLGLIFSAWMSLEKIMENSRNIVSAKSALANSKIQTEELENFRSKYPNYLPNFERINRAIVDPKNPLVFIEFLENSASENNVVLTISPLLFSKEPGLKALTAQILARGDFSDILSFLEKIENSRFLISVNSLIFEYAKESKFGGESAANTIQVNISANVLAR